MREHEVPTHVQAEDRVLLGFTFPQVVAVTAVCALSYGAYHYAPVGPSEVRMALAVLFGLVGIAMIVGKIGGRRLPLVAADLLKYRLGARRYAGQIAQLVRSEPPAPAQPVKTGPGPLRLMVRKARRGLRRLCKKTRQSKERRNGRMRWFGKRKGKDGGSGQRHDHRAETLEIRRRKPRMGWMAVATVPQAALADDHWRDEIDFEVKEPVPGRRIFVEGLSVTGDRAAVTLRAATALDIRVRAYGGPQGSWLRFWGSASLDEGERADYSLPLHGPAPSFTVSWEDTLGQAGALTFKHEQIPYPLPAVEGELCDLRMTSLGWTPGAVSGVIDSECVAAVEEAVALQTVAGHASVTETTAMDAQVTAIAGTVTVASGGAETRAAFVSNGETRFRLPVAAGATVHNVTISASLEATLRIAMPPLTQLTHHPERVEYVTKTVHLLRPGDSDSDSETATATCDDGATSSATATAYAYVPSATIAKEVTVDVQHKEHVRAEVVERSPITRTRAESLTLASAVGSDAPSMSWSCPNRSRKSRPPSRSPPTTPHPVRGRLCAAGSRLWAGSGPGEARDCGNPAGRGRAGDDRRGSGGGAGHDSRLRPCAHGDGLRRLRPLPVRHRLGRLHPDGRGSRGARRATRQDRRRHGGRRSRPGAVGQGHRRAAEQRPRPLPNTLEQRNLTN